MASNKTADGEDHTLTAKDDCWWYGRGDDLLQLMTSLKKDDPALYVYSLDKIRQQASKLAQLTAVNRIWFAVKSNHNHQVLKTLIESPHLTGGFECVSLDEIKFVRSLFPMISADKILFTPNFAAKQEYEEAFRLCKFVTLDNDWPLFNWPETFRGREIFLRLDCPENVIYQIEARSKNNKQHEYVKTTGTTSKFGIFLHDDIDGFALSDEAKKLLTRIDELQCKVVGLHVHRGSQVFDPKNWANNARYFFKLTEQALFPHCRYFNIGGGLGIDYHCCSSGQTSESLDLSLVSKYLNQVLEEEGHDPQTGTRKVEFWMEPGRFLVAEAGVLLAQVTQLKTKDGRHFVGTTAGMNSLLRPALYGSYHEIVNLTHLAKCRCQLVERGRDDDNEMMSADVVGQICESGDFLAKQRRLPACTKEGDIILIATAGAYGRVMANSYNMRSPPDESCL